MNSFKQMGYFSDRCWNLNSCDFVSFSQKYHDIILQHEVLESNKLHAKYLFHIIYVSVYDIIY